MADNRKDRQAPKEDAGYKMHSGIQQLAPEVPPHSNYSFESRSRSIPSQVKQEHSKGAKIYLDSITHAPPPKPTNSECAEFPQKSKTLSNNEQVENNQMKRATLPHEYNRHYSHPTAAMKQEYVQPPPLPERTHSQQPPLPERTHPQQQQQHQQQQQQQQQQQHREANTNNVYWLIESYSKTGDTSYYSKINENDRNNAIYSVNKKRNTPLMISVMYQNVRAFDKIFDFVSQFSSCNGQTNKVFNYLNWQNNIGMNALLIAFVVNNSYMIHRLLTHPLINITVFNANHENIFHLAIYKSFPFSVKDVLGKTGLINALNMHNGTGKTPIILAIEKNDHKNFQTYLDLKADLSLRDLRAGYTPLHYAAMVGNTSAIRRILASFPNIDYINTPAMDGNTPFHIAVSYGQDESVRALFESNADPFVRNRGRSILDMTPSNKDSDLRELINQLLNNGAQWETLNDISDYANY